jgi:hypothetical protein
MLTLLLFALAAAQQLSGNQYVALRTLFADLGCTAPKCPDFGPMSACPVFGNALDQLNCSSGSVVKIQLVTVSKLAGSINGAALGVLTALTHLQLLGLTLTTIPTQIGQLVSLTRLELISSALTGSLPSQVVQLRNLLVLDVADNKLTGTLPSLDKLTGLTKLDVSSNVGFAGGLVPMPKSIRELNFQNCSFTGLPPNLSSLTALDQIRAARNKLTGAPPTLVRSSVLVCILQLANTEETNCLDCPATGLFGQCECSPKNVTKCAISPASFGSSTTAATTANTETTISSTADSGTATATDPTAIANVTLPATTSGTLGTSGTSANADTPSSGQLEPWIVAVIIVGIVLVVVVVAGIVFCVVKRRRRETADGASELALKPQNAYGSGPPQNAYGSGPPQKVYNDVADVRRHAYGDEKQAPQLFAPNATVKF